MDSITINGTRGSTVVDCLPIHVKWQVNFNQKRFSIKVLSNKQCVVDIDLEQTETSYVLTDIKLEKSKNYQVEVTSYDVDNNQVCFVSGFVTSNFGEFDAQWITDSNPLINDKDYYQDCRNIVARKVLQVSRLSDEAYINIVGLGYYTLYVNGNKVSNYVLNNDWSNYSELVYYDTFDIRDYLVEGSNEILVELANGWYNPSPLTLFGKYNLRKNLTTGKPMLLAEITLRNGSDIAQIVGSDDTWEVAQGPYLFNNMYLGETVDFRLFNQQNGLLNYLNTEWVSATVVDGPFGTLRSSYIEKITKGREVTAKQIITLDETTHVVDFGIMVSGFVDITFTGNDGQVVEFLYSEEMEADGTINTDSSLAGFVGKEVAENVIVPGGEGGPDKAEQRDKIICRDGVIEFCNQYTYHSFRYVQVSGLTLNQLSDIKAVYVHNQLSEVGQFQCSNEDLNELYDAAKNTKLNNIHSVIEDCARERFAYGGDMIALAPSQVMMFNSAKLYEKTIVDFIVDRASNGGFPETAPFMGIQTKGTGGGAGPIGWQLAVPYLLKTHYQYYGNANLVKQVYPYLQDQLEHLNTLKFEDLDNFCLGDWGSKVANKENVKHGSPALGFTAACFYYYHITLLTYFAKVVGSKSDESTYSELGKEVKKRIVTEFKNDDGSYADRSQTSYIFAIYFELEDDLNPLVKGLEKAIIAAGYDVEFGIFGQGFFYSLVNKYGLNHLVYRCLQNESGIKSMLSDGNCALKEFFGDNLNGSCNHAMFSSYAYWFYNGLAGITVSDEAVGADQLTIKPYFLEHVDHVEASFESVQGKVISHWQRTDDGIKLEVSIPNSVKESLLILPKGYLRREDEHLISQLDEKHVYIDISDGKRLNLTLNTGLVHAKESS